MRHTLEQRYERLLFTYPPAYRAARGEELLATAMEMADPGQRFPRLREAVGFIVGGLRTRSRIARAGSGLMTWADGIRLGAAIVMALAFAGQINNLLFTTTLRPHLLPAAMAGVIVALLRAPRRIWLLLVALGLGLTWDHVAAMWSFLTAKGLAPTVHMITESVALPPALIIGNILPWVVPFVLAGVAFIWQPRAQRRPVAWPWWLVGLVIVAPSLDILKGVSTALYSVPAIGAGIGLTQLLWPLLLLGLALLVREARLGVAVAAWACGSLLMVGAFFPLSRPGLAWLLSPAMFAVMWLMGAIAVTAVVGRRLARV